MILPSYKDVSKKISSDAFIYAVLFTFCFFAIVILYTWKAPLDISLTVDDEPFWLMTAKRLIDGDALFADEWHGTQMSAIFHIPFVWIHMRLFGTEGIYLHFRYLYVAVSALCAIVIYIRLRSYKLAGVIATLFFFFFVPGDALALGYTGTSIKLMALTCTLLATADERGGGAVYCISGLLFAAAVLCTPHLILAYGSLSVVLFAYCARRRSWYHLRQWAWFTAGAAALAVLFAAFVFSRITVSELVQALPHIFSDPEHAPRSLGYLFASYCAAFTCSRVTPIVIVNAALAFLCFLAVIAAFFDKRRTEHREVYLLVSVAVAVAILISSFLTRRMQQYWSYNYIMLPFVYVGIMSFVVSKKKNLPVFLSFFCLGVPYTVALHLSSNTGKAAITAAYAVVNIGSVLLLGTVLCEMAAEHGSSKPVHEPVISRVLYAAVILLFTIQFSIMGYARVTSKPFSDADNRSLTAVIPEGPYKGIRVTEQKRDAYMRSLAAVQPLKDRAGTILIENRKLYLYMVLPNLKIGAPYAIFMMHKNDSTSKNVERLVDYYEMNPDKIPDYILLLRDGEPLPDAFYSEIVDAYGFHRETLSSAAEENGIKFYVRPQG